MLYWLPGPRMCVPAAWTSPAAASPRASWLGQGHHSGGEPHHGRGHARGRPTRSCCQSRFAAGRRGPAGRTRPARDSSRDGPL